MVSKGSGNTNPKKSNRLLLRILASFACGIILVIITLTGDRVPYIAGGEGTIMRKIEAARQYFGLEEEINHGTDDFFAINVGYDRELVTAYDEYGIEAGQRAIVSRGKLAQLLDSLQETGYKCIVMDVLFYEEDVTDSDSALFHLLNTLPNVISVTSGEGSLTPQLDGTRLASAKYGISINENNFVKYHYSSIPVPDVALKVYETVGGHTAEMSGILPTDDGRAATNSLCLSLPCRIDSTYDANGNKILFHIGNDLLNVYTRRELAELVKDKIIIIGDFSGGDDHETYAGTVQGPVIIMNAIMALNEGKHYLNPGVIICWLIVYSLIVWFIIDDPSKMLPETIGKSSLWRFTATFVSYTLIIAVMNIVLYLITGIIHDMFLPTLCVTVIYYITDFQVPARIKRVVKKFRGSEPA